MSARSSAWNPLGATTITAFLSAVLSIVYAVVTPPFQNPDEPAHYVQAIALSRGAALSVPGPAGGGSWIPSGQADFVREWMYLPPGNRRPERYEVVHFQRSREIERGDTLVFVPRASGRLPSRLNSNANAYVPFAHAVPALTELGCRALGVPVATSFYLMRLMNAAVATMVLAFAVAIAPSHRWGMALIALFPMAVSLRSSLSPDSVLLALALLAIALIWRTAADGFQRKPFVALLVVSAVMTAMKLPYLALALPFLAIPSRRFRSPRTRMLSSSLLTAVLLASVASSLIWLRLGASSQPSPVPVRSGPAGIFEGPVDFLTHMIDAFAENGHQYLIEIVGKLGWLNVPLPLGVSDAVLLVTVIVGLLAPGEPLSRSLRMAGGLAAMLALTLICFALFAYAPVAARGINGLQGRYFLPLLPLLMPLLPVTRVATREGERVGAIAVIATAVVSNGVAILILARTFY